MNDVMHAVVIDDEPTVLESLEQWLMLAGIEVATFSNARDALPLLDLNFPGVVVSDIKMPGMDGMSLLQAVDPGIPVILITGHGGIAQAVEAMKLGAYDFIEKPYKQERLIDVIKRACQQRRVTLATQPSHSSSEECDWLASVIIGESQPTRTLRQHVQALARVNADVVIAGETGTGKELVARSLHALSIRREQPFVPINVGAIPESLLESELFGHEAGAFTGAQKRRIGLFEAAHQGTLFLDEIESMPMSFQIKLLRVLQEREVVRVGSNTPVSINVRIISATKEDLREAANQGRFREDLYYRLMVADIHLPPLRERIDDVPVLFSHFLREAGKSNGLDVPQLSYEDLLALELHDWPGNVRELKHTAERYLLSRSISGISVADLMQLGLGNQSSMLSGERSLSERLDQVEKALITAELSHHKGNIKEVMRVLGLPRRTLNEKMQKHGLKREAFVGFDGGGEA
ncbi:two-component system, NtrC family, C4-dicarboxylate transport response regulator DctD [Marinobacter gudaonensis]|uniref:Two-component system, NtrC family, C4-dicarboxylate transport response regulator DctD n=1 Tax=Marinobacter gudaonensis TaxID=375760 RepID=A0A1I6HP13_9GAMM|nr:sigma-54 dependent transcriptional regulator [Marinobacter gudaonensis]SFR56138.1 two-component system, NtrC family, C4-dicarboxylate transport response regulator DctD [Marinobacter gudaonensis]